MQNPYNNQNGNQNYNPQNNANYNNQNYYNPNYNSNNQNNYYQPNYQNQYNQNGYNYYNPYHPPINKNDMELRMRAQAQRKKEKGEIMRLGLGIGIALICFILMQNIAVVVMMLLDLYDVYEQSAVFQYSFNIIAVDVLSILLPFGVLSVIMKKKFDGPVIPAKKVGFFKTCVWIAFGMLYCVAANYVTSFITVLCEQFGFELTQGEFLEPDSPFACLMYLISVSIVPGVFEELGMRCVSLGLLKKHGKGFGILAVSIVFGLMHGNVIQFIFAFLVGLVLAYITVRTDSVIPAMIIHALNNGLSVVQSITTYVSNEDTAETVTFIMFGFWAVAGIAALIYLVIKKEFKFKELFADEKIDSSNPYNEKLSLGTKIACLLPGFSVPLIVLIVETIMTVNKV